MASRSNAGAAAAGLVSRMGCRPVRGGSRKGGREALEELVEFARAGYVCALMADGPKGPPRVCKVGILSLARKSGVPIVPLVVSADRQWTLPNWDGTRFPKPFSRVVLIYGDPVVVAPDLSAEEIETLRLELEERMNRLQEEADGYFSSPPDFRSPL